MSEIPFVNQLGDAVEKAAERSILAPRPQRRWYRWRRPAAYAAIGALLVSGTAIGTGALPDFEQSTGSTVACYSNGSLDGNPTLGQAGDRSPVAVCADALRADGQPVPPLVACAHDAADGGSRSGMIAVVPGRTVATCDRPGLAPLPADYERRRVRFAALQRAVDQLEVRVDCLPPVALAARVQRILVRTGWAGWTTRLRLRGGNARGPCGRVTRLGGADRSLVFIESERRIVVFSGFARSAEDRLFLAGGLLSRLDARSQARCLTSGEIGGFARRAFSVRGLRVRIHVARMSRRAKMGGLSTQRYAAGCAVVSGVHPDGDPGTVVVDVFEKQ